MISLADVFALLKSAKKVNVSWNGSTHDLDLSDPVVLAAFGEYAVSGLYAVSEDAFEIALEVRPVKAAR